MNARCVLLGYATPAERIEEVLRTDPYPPHQTHNFSQALVSALKAGGLDVSVVSSLPVSTYPRNRRVLVARGGSFNLGQGVSGVWIPYVNLPIVKHLTRFAMLWGTAGRVTRDDQVSTVMVHGVHSAYLAYAVLLRARWHKNIYAVMTDPPGVVVPEDSRFLARMKRLDHFMVRWFLRHFNGVISLTSQLAESLAPSTPSLVMEGFIAEDLIDFAPAPMSEVPTLIYAGGLSDEYGVGRLLEAIPLMTTKRVVVKFFGKGPAAGAVERAGEADPRIVGPQFLAREALKAEYAHAWLLLQPRSPQAAVAGLSFPSKLLEYMGTGIPTASTWLSGTPQEYMEHLLPLSTESPERLAQSLDQAIACVAREGRVRGEGARQFLLSTRTPTAQGPRLRWFISRTSDTGQ